MSIINDAVNKARNDFEVWSKGISRDEIKDIAKRPLFVSEEPKFKWKRIVGVVSLLVIVSFLGSVILYNYISKSSLDYTSLMSDTDQQAPLISTKAHPRVGFPIAASSNLRLNGIVYGTEDKWAIINNQIMREDDLFKHGKLTHIAEDFVKVQRDDGQEIVLELK
ncbi:MAG: hypothetical protein QGI05_03960 [Candidatus Omnitrophota bacterium]|nr:hypothetical protein [Candidatus Omnitrophota bacterium]|tara:strand:- start:150 stop:644 length:495 start_codon:yes stop_codon:yes gene_type:complete